MRPVMMCFGAGVALLVSFKGALALDAATRGEADGWAAEVPADLKNPFAETVSEHQLKVSYREPEPIEAAAAAPLVVPAKVSGLASTVPPKAMKLARAIYFERCASCHGNKGDGAGPGAFAIRPRPRNYTDAEWQKSVTDEELAKAIVRGGAAVGKSFMMPASYDLKSRPDVVNGLIVMIRSFSAH